MMYLLSYIFVRIKISLLLLAFMNSRTITSYFMILLISYLYLESLIIL